MLPNDDQAYLAQEFPGFDQRSEGGMLCIVLPNYLLPTGLVPNQADLLLRLAPNYPDVPPDMWWFHPALRRRDGGPIPNADVTEQHLGKPWQRWSRHLEAHQWRPGADSLRTYLAILGGDVLLAAS